MLTSVLRESTTAVLMLCVTIPKDRTTVHVNLDILEMDCPAQVNHNYLHFDKFVEANIIFFLKEINKINVSFNLTRLLNKDEINVTTLSRRMISRRNKYQIQTNRKLKTTAIICIL